MPPILQSIVDSMFSTLVAITGIVLAAAMLQRAGTAALLAGAGSLFVLIADALAFAFGLIVVPAMVNLHMSFNQEQALDVGYFAAQDLMLAVGVALLLSAVYVGRPAPASAPPPHVHPPQQ